MDHRKLFDGSSPARQGSFSWDGRSPINKNVDYMKRNQFNTPGSGNNVPHNRSSTPYDGSPGKHQQKSPDFIPFGSSSPVGNGRRGQWKKWDGSRNQRFSTGSNTSAGNSSGSSGFSPMGFSPYQQMNRSQRFHSRGHMKRDAFRNPASISLYYHQSMVQDPWAELEQKLRNSSPQKDVNTPDAFQIDSHGDRSVSIVSDDSDEEVVSTSPAHESLSQNSGGTTSEGSV